jgi:hypothetical protein
MQLWITKSKCRARQPWCLLFSIAVPGLLPRHKLSFARGHAGGFRDQRETIGPLVDLRRKFRAFLRRDRLSFVDGMQEFGRAARDGAGDGEANRLGNLLGGEAVIGGASIEDDTELGGGRVVEAEMVDMPGGIPQGGDVGRAD